MRVLTPLGEYRLETWGIGRRGREILISGRVAGLESGLILGAEDLRGAARRAAPFLACLGAALILARRLR